MTIDGEDGARLRWLQNHSHDVIGAISNEPLQVSYDSPARAGP